ncbi:MAG: T9SS type A sorting domain-containing protein [Saprospiraceae bacterium]|nr:T9SS type A sorting domain-containing protein [Saprospiraceae bacterium]
MKKGKALLFSLLFIVDLAYGQFPTSRVATDWPFAQSSIWNMPIGADAIYLPAGIGAPGAWSVTVDEDILVLVPDAPVQDIVKHDAGWSDRLRCESIVEPREVLATDVPIPPSFSTDPGYNGLRPNHSAALLKADGRTIVQTQPFHICGTGGSAVSQFRPPDEDIYSGDGIRGAHGGSGMSSIGGTIRLGELLPNGVIRHALKVNLYAQKYLAFNTDGTPGYRWPAIRADGYANADTYGGAVPALEMGALLALLPDFNIEQLQTAPAKILARAFIDYGAYVVDDTAWDVFALATEWSPEGRVTDEFKETWGYDMETNDEEHPWAEDMTLLFSALQVVDNNSPAAIGGGGVPRQALAPPFDLTALDGTLPLSLQLDVFPNPAKDRVKLRFLSGEPVGIREIILWDMAGSARQTWSGGSIKSEITELSFAANLAAGLYYLEIRDVAGRSRGEKLVISSK